MTSRTGMSSMFRKDPDTMDRTPIIHLPPAPGEVSTAIGNAPEPCDVVEQALPVLVIGDLDQVDQQAMAHHLAICEDCRNIQHEWERELAPPSPDDDSGAPDAADALGLRKGHYGFMDSPVGDLMLVITDTGIGNVSYLANHHRDEVFEELEGRGILATERDASVTQVRDELREYFAGERNTFTVPVDLHGVTPFTHRVLDATWHVGFGDVRTYRGIATAIGNPNASRAVGNALGRNPVPVIVPCHRVVKSDGSMGWYTGGAHIKRALLEIEGIAFAKNNGGRSQPELPGLA